LYWKVTYKALKRGVFMSLEFNDILFYSDAEGQVKIDVLYEGDTFWLSQKKIAALFDVESNTITYHLKEIYQSKELSPAATTRKFRVVQREGNRDVNRNIDFYSLDAIIAVGYRVNSYRATQFRIWATATLKEFIIKGFVLDDERLKQGKRFGQDYFDELLERIREIRASERRFYQKITDIYKECSSDYVANDKQTQSFYKTVQNKLEWAITGKTAPELIADRASSEQANMGLKTWKKSPDGKILKSDVSIAKNYLSEKEIKELERVVSMYLDYAENQAARNIPMKMADWIDKLDAFLQFNEYDLLQNAGKISSAVAKQLAHQEYDKFRVIQDQNFESDFDRIIKEIALKKQGN